MLDTCSIIIHNIFKEFSEKNNKVHCCLNYDLCKIVFQDKVMKLEQTCIHKNNF